MENVAVVLETFMWLSMDFFFPLLLLLLLLLERCCSSEGFVLDGAGHVCVCVCVAGVAMPAEWAGLLLPGGREGKDI
jgi:hypothetical protein